jgi:hypothetical protein
VTTFGLLHGGWHTGWHWRPLAAELTARGHRVVAPDLPAGDPAAGAATYAAVAGAALTGGDTVLVAHSLAGLFAGLVPGVRLTVHLAAMLPVEGRSVNERAGAGERMTRRGLGRGQTVRRDGSTAWDPAAAAEWLYPDSPAETAAAAAARLRPQHWRLTAEPGVPPAPGPYVVCTADRVIDTDWARAARPDAVELAGDHSPFLARPGELAELLLRLAG